MLMKTTLFTSNNIFYDTVEEEHTILTDTEIGL